MPSSIRNPFFYRVSPIGALPLLILGGSFLVLYFPVLRGLIQDWRTNENFSHGFLIPLISAAMIYSRRSALRETRTRLPFNPGLLIVAAGLFQYFVGVVASEYFLQRSSMIVLSFGLTLFLFGRELTQVIAWPIAYLLLMIPLPAVVWNSFAFPMQLFSSMVAENIILFLGIPIFREGNILHLAETSLEVVDACSGLRSLTTMLAMSCGLAFFAGTSRLRRAMIVLAAIPIALMVNIVRLTGTAVLANRFGAVMAQGFLHDFSGWLVFVAGLVLLLAVTEILGKKFQDK